MVVDRLIVMVGMNVRALNCAGIFQEKWCDISGWASIDDE